MARALTRARGPRQPRTAAGTTRTTGGAASLTPIVGPNLRRLRLQRGLSLERLARLCGVSRAMLSQIELAQSTPTINVVWRIATALRLPFSALLGASGGTGTAVLRASERRVLASAGGGFTSRALFPLGSPRRVEFYALELRPGVREEAAPHAPGTVENLVVSEGRLELDVGGRTYALEAGDAVLFQADVPHAYRNAGSAAVIAYLVVSYAEDVR